MEEEDASGPLRTEHTPDSAAEDMINNMPVEILFNVWVFFPPRDAFNIYAVCTLWRELTFHSVQPWKGICNR